MILLVEDDEINQAIMRDALQTMQFDVVSAFNGQEAVVLCEQQAFDLILMDYRMPVLNGLEAARQIRNMQSGMNTKTPIIGLTGGVYEEDARQCAQAGMNACLAKPYTIQTLKSMIDAYYPK